MKARDFLKNIGVDVPENTTSFHTQDSDKLIFAVSREDKQTYFVETSITQDQADKMKEKNCFGSLGWNL